MGDIIIGDATMATMWEQEKGGERSSPSCLSYLLKLQLETTNNKRKKGGVTARNCSPTMKKKKQGEE
jgi:hypothetical protein